MTTLNTFELHDRPLGLATGAGIEPAFMASKAIVLLLNDIPILAICTGVEPVPLGRQPSMTSDTPTDHY